MNRVAVTCRRHRRALEAFIDREERGPRTAAALEHLARCQPCERDLTDLALLIVAMRRAGRELRAAPVPAVPSARVAALAVRRGDPWSFRLQLGSMVTGAAIAAIVVMPGTGLFDRFAGGSSGSARPVPSAVWRAAESRLAAAPDSPSFSAPTALPPRYPEGLTRPWKEVFPSDATPRELEPQ